MSEWEEAVLSTDVQSANVYKRFSCPNTFRSNLLTSFVCLLLATIYLGRYFYLSYQIYPKL